MENTMEMHKSKPISPNHIMTQSKTMFLRLDFDMKMLLMQHHTHSHAHESTYEVDISSHGQTSQISVEKFTFPRSYESCRKDHNIICAIGSTVH